MNKQEEFLLAQVIEILAQEFGKKAILRGGMVLRILGSPRYTNDLDYVFVPYKSKKDIVDQLLLALKKIPKSEISYSLNSKCLRIKLVTKSATIQIEAKVAKEQKTSVASNQLLAEAYNLPKRLIHIVDHSVSLSNKLAAWNERRLVRDLYDIWFFLQLKIKPDLDLLEARLKKIQYSRLVKKSEHFKGCTPVEFIEFLKTKVAQISNQELEDLLLDYLTKDEAMGVAELIKAGIARIVL